jgi:hypothetical protein
LLLAVKSDKEEGENDRKLHPRGVKKVAEGWRDGDNARESTSKMETSPESLVAAAACADVPCVGGNAAPSLRGERVPFHCCGGE